MPIELWIGQEFGTSHERRALDYFLTGLSDIEASLGQNDEFYFVLANYYVYGRQIDLTVLKRNAIIVVELKEYPDPFRASENGDWVSISGGKILGTSGQNPYKQVADNRFKWIALLQEKQGEFLPAQKAQQLRLDHVSAFVIISPSLHPDSEVNLPRSAWFRLIGLDESDKAVYQQTSQRLNFSKHELKTLVADVLQLKPALATSNSTHQTRQHTKNPLYKHFKEAAYPPDHHIEDIHAIKQVIRTNNSLLVLGLSGSGKSSVLRFLVSNPSAQSEGIIFVYIDCNVLDWARNKETVQEEICSQIIEHLQLQNIGGETVSVDNKQARDTLRLLMRDIAINGPEHLAVIFDRSELLQDKLGRPFFNYLRALRDINPRLSYIFGGRSLTPEVFDELADILWHAPYWIGALSTNNAKMTIQRHSQRLGINLEADEIDKLLRCIGPHPQLLKYGCELIQARKINLSDNENTIIQHLLMNQLIERQCQDLWQDLDTEAQCTLQRLAQKQVQPTLSIAEWLIDSGVLIRLKNDNVKFASNLFKRYIGKLESLN